MLNADLIISVAGIPLLGANLKLALAGMETMLEYGIMQDWDEAQRAVARKEAKRDKPVLMENEEIILSMFGTYWSSRGIYRNWRPGHFYVTNKRLILFRKMPPEILFETPYERIKGMALPKKHFSGEEREELHLLLEGDEVAQLHAMDTAALKRTIEERLKIRGITLEENPAFPVLDEVVTTFLHPGEEITHTGRMWHLMSLPAPGGVTSCLPRKEGKKQFVHRCRETACQVMSEGWKPGHLYLTDQRLCWWYDFDGRLAFQTPLDNIMHVMVERRALGGMRKQREALLVLYRDGQESKVACFSGDETSLRGWEKAIGERLRDLQAGRGTETCPRCGRRAPVEELLEEGCPRCGWVSPRLKQRF